jgi:hypothetical protein
LILDGIHPRIGITYPWIGYKLQVTCKIGVCLSVLALLTLTIIFNSNDVELQGFSAYFGHNVYWLRLDFFL